MPFFGQEILIAAQAKGLADRTGIPRGAGNGAAD